MINRFFKTIYQIGAYTHNRCRSTRPNEQTHLLMPAANTVLDLKHSTATASNSNLETNLVVHSHAEIEKLTREAAEDKRVADIIRAGVHTRSLNYWLGGITLFELVGISLILINRNAIQESDGGKAGIIITFLSGLVDVVFGIPQGLYFVNSRRNTILAVRGECDGCPITFRDCISDSTVTGYVNKIQVNMQAGVFGRTITRDQFIEASQEHHRQQVIRINDMVSDNNIMRETARHLQSFFCPKDPKLTHRLPKEILPIILSYAAPITK